MQQEAFGDHEAVFVVVPMKIRGKVFLFVFYFLNKYCYNILKKIYHSFHRKEIG